MTRTRLLAQGKTLCEATREITQALGVKTRVLPMSDACVETRVATEMGDLSFQEYFVRERWQPKVRDVRFAGSEAPTAAPGVVEAIHRAAAVLIAPSNPITSIGPMLAVLGIREALRETKAPVAAISPIVGGAAVSGPAGELMRSKGLAVSVAGVAQAYADFLHILIADEQDRGAGIDHPGIDLHFCDTLMKTDADKLRLAEAALAIMRVRNPSKMPISKSK